MLPLYVVLFLYPFSRRPLFWHLSGWLYAHDSQFNLAQTLDRASSWHPMPHAITLADRGHVLI